MEPLRRAFRGYEPAQVERLLADYNSRAEALSREVELLRNQNDRLIQENADLKSSLEMLSTKEKAVNEALVTAHQQSEDILSAARRDSEVLLQVAREAGARMQQDLRGRISDLNWKIESLSLQKQKFEAEFRTLLEGYLGELSSPQTERSHMSETSDLTDLAVVGSSEE
jgi:cell division septum initiation protein DivIVA